MARSTTNVYGWTPTATKQLFNYDMTSLPPPVWTSGSPIVSGMGTRFSLVGQHDRQGR